LFSLEVKEMKHELRSICVIGSILAGGSAQAEAPRVLVSIAPIHSLTAAIMEGAGEPELLVPGNVSDHDYAMRPSDIRKIAGADLVVWIGGSLETYLAKPLQTEGVPALELIEAAGVEAHPYAESGGGSVDDHAAESGQGHDAESAATQRAAGHPETTLAEAEGEQGHDHLGLDPHVWLDPVRAQAIVRAVAERLAEMDAEHAEAYRSNAESMVAELQALDGEIRQQLASLSEKPFITFHDGYAYFVERYGLNQVGQLSVEPEQQAGAASVRALRELVAAQGVACAFAEPQFDPGVIDALAGETRIKVGLLDAIGADLDPGPSLYASLLRKNAAAVTSCLTPTS